MRLVDFNLDVSLPNNLTNWCLLIRNRRIYRFEKATNKAWEVFGSSSVPDSINFKYEEGDRLFNFPDEATLVKAMEQRSCLDNWKVELNAQRMPQVVKLLQDEKFIGFCSTTNIPVKYKLFLKNSRLYGGTKSCIQNGRDIGITENDLKHTSYQTWVFDNEVDFWTWFLSIS